MNQKVTTNQLAVMIAKGFREVDNKITTLEKKVDRNHLEVMREIHDLQATKANYVSKFEHKRLVHRVEVLEDKI